MFDLSGRKALVTGASGGIGEAIARALHRQGATVGLHGTRQEKLESLAAELGDRVKVFPANLSNRDEVKALGQKAEAELARPRAALDLMGKAHALLETLPESAEAPAPQKR